MIIINWNDSQLNWSFSRIFSIEMSPRCLIIALINEKFQVRAHRVFRFKRVMGIDLKHFRRLGWDIMNFKRCGRFKCRLFDIFMSLWVIGWFLILLNCKIKNKIIAFISLSQGIGWDSCRRGIQVRILFERMFLNSSMFFN